MPLVCHSDPKVHNTNSYRRVVKYGTVDEQGRPARACRCCEIVIFNHEIFCKCCNGKLRTKRRNQENQRRRTLVPENKNKVKIRQKLIEEHILIKDPDINKPKHVLLYVYGN